MQTTEHYLKKLNIGKEVRSFLYKALLVLSLIVVLGVFWELKLTGITLAGEAFCGMSEHQHSDACLLPQLVCGLEESEGHTHSQDCCEKILQCTLPEQEGHTHSEECGISDGEYLCGLEEAEAHFHDESCCIISEETYICGLEESEGHTHSDDCYEALDVCPFTEHIHVPSCYSNLQADLETSAIWCAALPNLDQSSSRAIQLVQVAASQLGYEESTLNFQVDENGLRRGITRYGQWYGNPYGDWSAMFVGFCLRYSGLDDLPVSAGPEAMLLEWDAAGLYGSITDFAPAEGNLLFLDKNLNGSADAVAIITGISGNTLQVMEGDVNDAVVETGYSLDDPALLGYGLIPTDQPYLATEGITQIAKAEEDNQLLFVDGNCIVAYIEHESGYYAIDGNGDMVQVVIDAEGWIYTDLEVPEMLLWNVTETEDGGYVIENVVTQMYLPESITPVATYAAGDEQEDFGPILYANASTCTVFLDGTLGGLMAYTGAGESRYEVARGSYFQLPTSFQSPSKYNYVIKGWYEVVTGTYYEPGATVQVTGDLVFYADWIAATYDIGQFNAHVDDTVSTNDFITVRMFDYNALFNVLSASPNVSFTTNRNNIATAHSETWNILTSGNNPYNGEPTLDFIFRDWDEGKKDITYPNGIVEESNTGRHWFTTAGNVFPNLYNDRIRALLFDPDVQAIGKTYLGTGDYLFQLCTDTTHNHFGYYYYNSERNAASYNQSEQRFYVYDYLEQTTDSATTDSAGKGSDFLPLNSPYANTAGSNLNNYTYTHTGTDKTYTGYLYSSQNSSNSPVSADFLFGMSVEIDFYLPSKPGAGGNKDVFGDDMHFRFSGDDDVWIFVDGKMVLDLGGIHGIEGGDINFSTGVVTVNGTPNDAHSAALKSIGAGDHKLTIYYLERGSSMANCAIYFNLAPRFSFSIQKEDVLTQDVLNGAEFSVYTDEACTQPASLWVSKESHDRGDKATNVFTVTNGVANMWGMGAGNTYYIKETRHPDNTDYERGISGIICVKIDKMGHASYSVDMLEEGSNGVTSGFTVHGFRIDTETQQAYIVATNAPKWVTETTKVTALKKWNDTKDHSGDAVTVYLTITDADGTVRRLQEAQLSSANNWRHTWENLPKYAQDGKTLIQYGVEEAYVSGYYSKVSQVEEFTVSTEKWQSATSLENGKTYILGYNGKYLSTPSNANDTGFVWVTEDVAKESALALWTVKTSGNKVMLTNGANQTLSFYYGNGSYITDFFAATNQTESNDVKRYFTVAKTSNGIRLYYDANTDYYLSANLNSDQKFAYTTDANSAMTLTPWTLTGSTTTEKVVGWGYEITNTPLTQETSLTVTKSWDYGKATNSNAHEKAQVTVKLLANGKDTGRTVTLSLKNNWTDTFRGLPYLDDKGNVISYTVVESWDNPDWVADYGAISVIGGSTPSYTTSVTNRYLKGMGGPELPSTGYRARMLYELCGGAIMLASLVYGIGTRRKRERRKK